MKFNEPINRNALLLAFVSFLIGSCLLLTYIIYPRGFFITTGYTYLIIAFAINSAMLVALLVNTFYKYKNYKENLLTISLFLLNIPICLGYLSFII
ncbi:hypothetical protein ACFSTE_09725 [Aquimarina hainanensis]|uniref:Uncharacterized protein n=1 Tax=Aquimarina hainanensis TaxID=1578017 RepID=A0ABW5N821_9FLAO